MALDFVPILLLIATVISSIALFLQKKLLRSVIFLALTAIISSLILIYLGQVLVALLQLLVFVGGLSTYLVVAVATEEKQEKLSSKARLIFASIVIAMGLSLLVYSVQPTPAGAGNDFSTAAQFAFSSYYVLLFASIFLLFAAAIGSILVMKKFSRLVV
jgi:NADH:ubiquinone oxidoreductase subunit 6 (subunit J)